jgi:hypothetical protein
VSNGGVIREYKLGQCVEGTAVVWIHLECHLSICLGNVDDHVKPQPGEPISGYEPGNVTCWLSKLMAYNHHRNDVSWVNLKWYNGTQRTAVSACHHWSVLSDVDTGTRIVLFLTAGKQARGSARCGGRGKRRPASERTELFYSSPPTSASCCIVDQQSVCSSRAKRKG